MNKNYSTILVEKTDLELLREVSGKLLQSGIRSLDPKLQTMISEKLGKERLDALSRGTIVTISLLAMDFMLAQDEKTKI